MALEAEILMSRCVELKLV